MHSLKVAAASAQPPPDFLLPRAAAAAATRRRSYPAPRLAIAPSAVLPTPSPSTSRRVPARRSKSHQRLRLEVVRAAACSRRATVVSPVHHGFPAPTRSLPISPLSPPTPTPANPPRHYIFGYGSLIHPKSRLRTLPAPSLAIPATVNGLQRSWSYPCPRNRYTAVGVTRVDGACSAKCNGVLIPLEDYEADLRSLDARETHYSRALLQVSDIVLDDETAFDRQSAIVWVYELAPPAAADTPPAVATKCHSPSPNIPIPQSYVDVILEGCLQYGASFAADFVLHTKGWEGVWVNDRHADVSVRRYVRNTAVGEADPAAPAHLDEILRALVPAAFGQRVEL
ncbi:hypothetical protein HDU87_007499 [Geranomyces variabilis]|uniref:Gamma-glutamylcyclotransferase AIG2-like domain-containing protein n=1 Tax=Geranomyces variabilis TaxID=109894 RepID=A0AAD5TPJ1_9FUNG|nr:hypothetical protein HDU87_007499 [Geranomyces variabilis]